MDIVYRRGQATIQDILDELPDPPSYSAVRALVRVLEDKGLLQHSQDGPRYVYAPTVNHARAARSALSHLVETFFRGSTLDAVATLLELEGEELSREQLDELSAMIERAREQETSA